MRISGKTLVAALSGVAIAFTGVVAAAQPAHVSANYLTGVWKENPQCRGNEAMVFLANGTMSSAGSVPVNYTVVGGNQILMYGPGGQVPIQVQYVNQNKMVLTAQNDASILHRCSASAPSSNRNVSISAANLAGGWGEKGNCSAADIFTPGGHFQAANGNPGTWALFGNTLRLTVQNGAAVDFAVQALTQIAMTLNLNGTPYHYKRCF